MRLGALLALMAAVALHAQNRDEILHKYFYQAQGSRFTVLFEGGEDYELANRALDVLNEGYERIGAALVNYPQAPITVVLYTQQQFQDITRAPAWAAGAFDGKIRIPIRGALSRPEELQRVLSHELAHAMIHAIAPRRVPYWLNEGLAVAFEPQGSAWADAELARSRLRLPFRRLADSFRGLSGEQARVAYAQSAVMAKRLLDEAGGPTMVAILRDLAAGQSFQAAYEQRLFLSYDVFLSTLDATR